MEVKPICKHYCKNPFVRFVALATLIFISGVINAQITTGALIKDMTNLKKLAEYPSPFYNTIQYSSYDRRSTLPNAPGWFENSDGFGGEPIPGFEKVLKQPGNNKIGEYLICDMKGPGAIVRLWTAAINGNIRLYLDGSKKPVYDGNAYDFFVNTYKAISNENRLNLKGSFTQNMAGYYPIPFAKGCKIIWEGDIKALHFYHVNIRMYEKGTKVETFKPEDLIQFSEAIESTDEILKNPDVLNNPANSETVSFAGTIQNDEEKEVLKLKGNKSISVLKIKIHNQDIKAALRQTILRVSFDGAADPQIQSPVGDFFGTAAGLNPYKSLPFTVTKEGELTCRYFMPFKDSVSIVVENLGDKEITLTGETTTENYNWNENMSMYFRAKWRIGNDLKSSYDQPSDITYLQTSGKGVFVGAAAHLMNPSNVPSTYGNWWGEGDEKIFVDDNPFPVFFGTGSEDYFNYAWSSPDIFYEPYCGQPRNDGPGTKGFVTNYRWHIIDNIPFEEQFAFYMELLSHEPVPGFSYARIAYLYGFKRMHDDNDRISKGDVRELELPERWYPVAKKGSANSLFYEAEDLISNNENTSLLTGRLWTGGELLEWIPEQAGDKMVLDLPILEDGNYVIYITVRLDGNSGQVQANLNESDFNHGRNKIDLNTIHGTLSRTFSSARLQLKRGANKLNIESIDAKPVGIDFIWIQKR